MSLWADYVRERLGWETLEVEGGFISFSLSGTEFTVEELYVRPELRGGPLAKRLADEAFRVARESGAKRVWAKVVPGLPGSEHALKSNLHYGFRLAGVKGNDIILVKEVGG